jgi:hypothetical protein
MPALANYRYQLRQKQQQNCFTINTLPLSVNSAGNGERQVDLLIRHPRWESRSVCEKAKEFTMPCRDFPRRSSFFLSFAESTEHQPANR